MASLTSGLEWIGHFSVFHYMALAPAEHVDGLTVIATLAVAGLLCGGALFAFSRRDVRSA